MPMKMQCRENPIESAETYLLTTDQFVKRLGENEVIVNILGKYCEFQALLSWNEMKELFHLSFGFSVGLKREISPPALEIQLAKLIALLNENLHMGHFEIWREEYGIVWRYAQFLDKSYRGDENFFMRLLDEAQQICEQNFPAFQYVLWGGKSPELAAESVLFETLGTA
jgi:hypothetical protein